MTPLSTPATPLDSKAVAEALNITAKELHVYLRAVAYEKTDRRYLFTKANVASLRKGYATWSKQREAARAARAETKVAASEADAGEVVADAS
ncbi:hypothetical protein EB72_11115 [Mycobacterium sp. SWH-M1]|nr:hypothetical protein EB72_11115 [Mycobacterium sp. SWH-M1]